MSLARFFKGNLGHRLRTQVLPNIGWLLTRTTIRRCGCCDRVAIFPQFGSESVLQLCSQCGASFRYEMMGRHIRARGSLSNTVLLELDPGSALQRLFSQTKSHIRTYFRPDDAPGSTRADGVVMQDITRLTYNDNSLDMIVSSDVLEHVPDIRKAFEESARTLKPGGVHIFTIPRQSETRQLAELRDGQVHHLMTPPEYHSDPLDPKGILAFWHFGPDLQEQFGYTGLQFERFKLEDGPDRWAYVWEARKPA
jgi:SAM-dependent methyltransferase